MGSQALTFIHVKAYPSVNKPNDLTSKYDGGHVKVILVETMLGTEVTPNC